MRWCPNCKKEVYTKFTGGQIAILILLIFFFFPAAILYGCLHTRKCPYCYGPTYKHVPGNQPQQPAQPIQNPKETK